MKSLAYAVNQNADAILTVLAAFVVTGTAILVVQNLVKAPSPLTVRRAPPLRDARVGVMVLVVVAAAFFLTDYVLYWTNGDYLTENATLSTVDSLSIVLGILLTGLAWLLSLADAIRCQRWGWLAAVVGLPLLVTGMFLLVAPSLAITTTSLYSAYVAAVVYGLFGGSATRVAPRQGVAAKPQER